MIEVRAEMADTVVFLMSLSPSGVPAMRHSFLTKSTME